MMAVFCCRFCRDKKVKMSFFINMSIWWEIMSNEVDVLHELLHNLIIIFYCFKWHSNLTHVGLTSRTLAMCIQR